MKLKPAWELSADQPYNVLKVNNEIKAAMNNLIQKFDAH